MPSIVHHRDRATYDPKLTTAVNYTVADPSDAPNSLAYGPSFFALAERLKGDVTVGLNRQLNNITITRLAAVQGQKTINPAHLLAFELGNEPDCTCVIPCSILYECLTI